MAEQEHPQLYLITPTEFDLSTFSTELAALLDGFDIACVRLRQATDDLDVLGRNADVLRDLCHQREVPLVIDTHFRLVETHGLDGVHLPDGSRNLRDIRKELGKDAIIGSYCGNLRHDGMTAAEIGADYVAFGPVSETPIGGEPVEFDTVEWWSQTIEVPVVVEGFVTLEAAEQYAPVTDFFALGSELWLHEQGAKAALTAYLDRIK